MLGWVEVEDWVEAGQKFDFFYKRTDLFVIANIFVKPFTEKLTLSESYFTGELALRET